MLVWRWRRGQRRRRWLSKRLRNCRRGSNEQLSNGNEQTQAFNGHKQTQAFNGNGRLRLSTAMSRV
eukprot:582622-Rhodomonas_salina.2